MSSDAYFKHYYTLHPKQSSLSKRKRTSCITELTYFRHTGHQKPAGYNVRCLHVAPFPLHYLVPSSVVVRRLSVLRARRRRLLRRPGERNPGMPVLFPGWSIAGGDGGCDGRCGAYPRLWRERRSCHVKVSRCITSHLYEQKQTQAPHLFGLFNGVSSSFLLYTPVAMVSPPRDAPLPVYNINTQSTRR